MTICGMAIKTRIVEGRMEGRRRKKKWERRWIDSSELML